MELISDISSFNNPFENSTNNTINSVSKNIIKNDIKTDEFIKQFELDKIIEENLKKYNDIKSNVEMIEEIITELEKKSLKILQSIKYLEDINKESIQLFTHITR